MTTKQTESAPLPPVPVTVIGTGAITGGPAPMTTGTVATTAAAHQPNLLVTVISPVVAITVRFGFQFLTSMLSFLSLKMVPSGGNEVLQAIHAVDFGTLLYTAAGLSLAPAGYDLIKNLITIFGRLEQKFPLMTGNV